MIARREKEILIDQHEIPHRGVHCRLSGEDIARLVQPITNHLVNVNQLRHDTR